MFDAKDVITDAVNAVVLVMRRYGRGDVVPWPLIESTAGFARQTQHWTAFVRRLKRELRHGRGVTLTAIPGVGWRIDTQGQQLHDRSIRRQRRAVRQMTMDVVELKALPDEELSDHERTTKYRKIDRAKQGRRGVLYSLRVGHQLAKPTSTGLPRIKAG